MTGVNVLECTQEGIGTCPGAAYMCVCIYIVKCIYSIPLKHISAKANLRNYPSREFHARTLFKPGRFSRHDACQPRWFSPSATFAPLFTLRATSRPPPLLAPLRWSTDHPSRQSAKRPCSNIFRQTPRGMHKAIANGIGNALDAAPPLFLPPLSEGARAANETTDTRWQVSK